VKILPIRLRMQSIVDHIPGCGQGFSSTPTGNQMPEPTKGFCLRVFVGMKEKLPIMGFISVLSKPKELAGVLGYKLRNCLFI
jgi:hypothetical protein